MIAAKSFYTSSIDVYALSITIWEIWTGDDCYIGKNQFDIYKYVEQGQRPEITSDFPPQLVSILEQAWHQDSDKRPTAKQLTGLFESYISSITKEDGDYRPFEFESIYKDKDDDAHVFRSFLSKISSFIFRGSAKTENNADIHQHSPQQENQNISALTKVV